MVDEVPTIRVFLLDDHEVVRDGIRHLIEVEDDMEVVGEAATVADAIGVIERCRPTVAVLDVRLSDGSGIEVCREVRSDGVACLIFTSFPSEDTLFDAIMAGAAGYVVKDVGGTELISSIRRVAAGHCLLDRDGRKRVIDNVGATGPSGQAKGLSAQEARVLDLLAQGLTNRQIGAELFLTEKTVKNYVSKLLGKLGVSSRTQAALYAVRNGVAEDHTVT